MCVLITTLKWKKQKKHYSNTFKMPQVENQTITTTNTSAI